MLEWLKWYLTKFGSRELMTFWLAWLGMVTLCVIEIRRCWSGHDTSVLFNTVLGGVIGYAVGRRSAKDEDAPEAPPGRG